MLKQSLFILANLLLTRALIRTFMSTRISRTDNPYIEDILDKYALLPDLTMLALGSVYWAPPQDSVARLSRNLIEPITHKYGSILGNNELRSHALKLLQSRGLNTNGMDIAITAGANQAFANAALAVCDQGDNAVLLAPYYFSHKMSLQLCGAHVHTCPFHESTLTPDLNALERMVADLRPKMVVLTSPNNPSGHVYTHSEVLRIVEICRSTDAWLVADQTYHEFLYDDAVHVFPNSVAGGAVYDNVMHIFSFSKIFGMPGWRVGYIVFPDILTPHMRKLQDTIPTHATVLSQQLALHCLQEHYPLPAADADVAVKELVSGKAADRYSEWASGTVGTLVAVREALWPVVRMMGTVRTNGAFYFLVPVPPLVGEEEAVDILARQFGVLLMPGTAFAAPQHMRLSYGSIPPAEVLKAVDKLQRGFAYLIELSASRVKNVTPVGG